MTEIMHPASAGTLESSDAYVEIEPCAQGIEISLESNVPADAGCMISVTLPPPR